MAIYLQEIQHPIPGSRRFPRRSSRNSFLADCEAAELLVNELERYCGRRVTGRSILVAGLRGAGKTTLVRAAISQVTQKAFLGSKLPMRPLTVELLGPNIFVDGTPGPMTLPRVRQELDVKARQRVLEQVVLGLYAKLSAEFVDGFREKARPVESGDTRSQHILEIAASLEARLTEGPTPAELREYWRAADALESGVLFPGTTRKGQGMLELVALSGLGYAYQRVSGTVTETNQNIQATSDSQERSSGWDVRMTELVKPLASLVTGGLVAAAVAPSDLLIGLLSGVVTAVAAGMFFRVTASGSRKEDAKRDRTFLPNTKAETLDRVLPELIQRLMSAGLAPVIVIDELDKVETLWERHDALLANMKKLFAETVFTCCLVNRDFIESLHDAERENRYGRNFSYFTHRAYVSYDAKSLHDYLDQVLEVTG